MAQERERKYLVTDDSWRAVAGPGEHIRQGYLAVTDRCAVRVRIRGSRAYLTVKGKRAGDTRLECEYQVPVQDAEQMLSQLCGSPVEKNRYEVLVDGALFEVDEFDGRNRGLILAERELNVGEEPGVGLPQWAGLDVTADERFYNAHLSRHPFSEWQAADRAGPQASRHR